MSCIHGCIPNICHGNPDLKRNTGCRFDLPLKERDYTVPTVIEVNSEQVEIHLLLVFNFWKSIIVDLYNLLSSAIYDVKKNAFDIDSPNIHRYREANTSSSPFSCSTLKIMKLRTEFIFRSFSKVLSNQVNDFVSILEKMDCRRKNIFTNNFFKITK
jgi:hypothetical protein